MSMMSRKLIKDLLDAFKASEKNKTTGYDTSATVKRIENGTAWVHIPGGVDETPAKLTINANVGDIVQVRVSGGKAFLIGNGSAPPTDDTTAIKATRVANKAHRTALQASEEATEAWNYAGTAAEAAISAQTSADSASQAADRAWEHADEANQAATEAKASAISANNSANNALVQLSVVEDVAGTLRWISEHGDYVLTNDDHVYADTVYFIKQGGDYIPIVSPDPSKNPSAEGWYILDVTQSTTDYIMSHVAVTSAGLWVLPVNQLSEHPLVDSSGNQIIDSSENPIVDFSEDPQYSTGYKVLLSGGERTGEVTFPIGLTIYNDEGEAVANYGVTTTIGATSGKHIFIDTDSVDIKNGQNLMAIFGQETAIFSTDGTELAHFGYALLSNETYSPYYTLGSRVSDASAYSSSSTYKAGDLCTYDDKLYICDDDILTPEAWNSSHWSLAIGSYSMAEGDVVVSSGYGSHAEGNYTKAQNQASHAEGYNTHALGSMSHAGGMGTIARGRAQTVIGRYNVPQGDPTYIDANNDYAFIIGIGTSNSDRNNGFTVDWVGNAKAKDFYSNITYLDLGSYQAAGLLTSTAGLIRFSIPTGRVFPSGTTISVISFNVVARVANANGTGYYCIKSTSGGTTSVALESDIDSSFYNAGDAPKTLTPAMWTKTLHGGTNIQVTLDGNANDFFSGTSTIRGYVNNQPVILSLDNIKVYLQLPS